MNVGIYSNNAYIGKFMHYGVTIYLYTKLIFSFYLKKYAFYDNMRLIKAPKVILNVNKDDDF